MKEKFESILLQLKSNLKSDSVINALNTDKDKELHEKLINVVNNYYENIDLFDKQKESLKKLLFDNANNLLSNTNSGIFSHYLPNYRNYANFLIDNYYKNENNSSVSISIEDKLNEFLLKLSNEKKNIDIKPEKFLLNSEEFNLLTKELESRNLIKGQRFLSGEYLFQGLTFEGIKYLEKLNNKGTEDLTNKIIKEEIIEIPSLKFENLPEKELRFSTWKEIHDWAMKEFKEWEHWYQYISDMPQNIRPAMNIQRGATVRLWSESQKLIKNLGARDFKRFSRMATKALNDVNESNPIVSYSELGKKMIDAMDNNPDKALEKYQNEFLKLLKNDILVNKVQDNTKEENNNFIIGNTSLIGEKTINEKKIEIHKNNIATFSSDNPSNENNDSLNTKSDINAFAKLIAYKDLKPPLAIGLFGKWGSGKSTFMDNLKRKIEKLSKEENSEKIFHEKIAHIEFNAWHYSDSNLWANLMIQIFEKLNEFLKPKVNNEIKSLYLKLESTKELLLEKEEEKNIIESRINSNKEILKNKTNEKIEKIFNLNQLKDITKLIFEDEYIKSKLNSKEIQISFGEIEKISKDFNSTFFTLLTNDKQFQIYLAISIFITSIILGVSQYIDILNGWFSLLIVVPFGQYYKRFKEITSKVSKILEFYKTLNKEKNIDELELNLLKEQANLDSELTILEETISLENRRLEEISFEIEHIKSGKYLADFIMERANSSDYKQHLGLISLIRNDLEKLNEHLKQPLEDAEYKIDRIVLYIDDLDRCSENKIMDVLEAIHLLLAFDLFVVIVGVDTRWIKKSLESKRNLEDGKTATATEYLEKIFQIPFHLNTMEEDVKKEQLKKLMKNDLILNDEKINNKDEDKLEENLVNDFTYIENDYLSNEREISQDNSNKKLKIEQLEYDYILKNSKHLGETPRTIKRFVNIYRIIRSHEYILNELLTDFGTQYKYIVMFLCLNDKYHKYDKNSDDNDKLTIDNYIQKLKDLKFDANDINDLENFEKKDELFKFISRFSFRDCK